MPLVMNSRTLMWALLAVAANGCGAGRKAGELPDAGVHHGMQGRPSQAVLPSLDFQSANGDFGFSPHIFQTNLVADCSLAVGPNHVVTTVNRRIRFHTKAGALTFDQDLNLFFSEFRPQGQHAVDTSAIFDPYSRRFFLSTMFFPEGSTIVVAVSDDDDPNGSWFKFGFDTSALGDYVDYPTLGVDEKAIYVSVKFTGLSGAGVRGAWTIIFEKQALLEGRAPQTRTVQLWDDNLPLSGTQVLGPAPAYYQILTGVGAIFMRAIEDPLGDPSSIGVRVELPKPWEVLENVPISGGSGQILSLPSHFYRTTQYSKGSLWAVNTVRPPGGPAKHVLRWYRIRLNGFPLSGVRPEVAEWGEIDAGAGAQGPVSILYPDFEVDEQGNMFFVLQLASPDGRVDAARAYRLFDDPPDSLRGLEVQKAGSGPVAFPGWQDFSSLQLDPDEPGVFWGHTGYTQPGSWRTWVGRTQASLPAPQLEKRLLFAQFAGGGGLSSDLLLFNPDEVRQAQVKVRIRNSEGQAPRSDLLEGFDAGGEISLVLEPNQLQALHAGSQGDLERGSVEVLSDLPLTGTVLFSGPFGLAGVAAGPEAQSFTVPVEIDAQEGINTGVAVMNLDPAEGLLGLELLDDGGQVLAQGQRPLAAEGQSAFFANEVEWSMPIDLSAFQGLLRVSSSGPASAVAIQTRPGEFATFPTAAQARTSLYFPQFAEGEGALASEILLVNLDPLSAAEVEIDLRLRDGSPMNVDLNGQQVSGSLAIPIAANGMAVLASDGEGPLVSGSVSVTSDRPLAGTIVFSGLAGAAGVAASSELTGIYHIPIQSDAQEQIRTGLAVMNLEEAECQVQIALLDQAGTVLAGDTRTLPPKGSFSLFADEFDWTRNVNLAAFRGSIRVAAARTAATAIQSRPGQFATLPVGIQEAAAPGAPEVQTVAALPAATGGLAVDGLGNIFVADIGLAPARQGTTVYKVTPQGDAGSANQPSIVRRILLNGN